MNANSRLWPNNRGISSFASGEFIPIRQKGKTCVSTALAVLTKEEPKLFQESINTQDPTSWSQALVPFGMKLAYCPHDVRKIKHYLDELIAYNDLFLLCYYSTRCSINDIMGDPNEDGWVCGSHVVILHKDQIIDSKTGKATIANEHECYLKEAHTKRIFRVVPADHERGL